MLARKLISFNSLFRPVFSSFYFSTSIYNNLFKSNYHLNGPNNFQKYEEAARLNEAKNIAKITQAASKLNPLREKAIKYFPKKVPTPQEKHPSIVQYAKGYVDLLKLVQKAEMNNIWIWNIIGWYNFTSMYGELYWQLITTTSQQQLRNLITCLNMMTLEPNEQFDRILNEIYQTTNYQQFYKTLFPNLQLQYLRLLENIIKGPRTYSKRKYYEWYLRNHLESILKNLDPYNYEQISDLIWLLQASIKQLCDDDILIGKIEKYLLTMKAAIKDEQLQRFINMYKVKGKINDVIYEEYLKQYILKNKLNSLDAAIDTFEFYVYSQVEDEQLLDAIYDKLRTINSISQISSKSAEKLHILSHFQKITNNQLELSDNLTSQLDNMCANKKFHDENQNNIDGIVLKTIVLNKNKKQFVSSCLVERTEQLTPINQEQIDILETTNILKNVPTGLKEAHTYGKNKFCCFDLEYCLQSKTTSEIVIFQLSSINNCLNSGRLVRQMHIRDKILKYYGVRVHYPNSFGLKTKGKLSEEDFMISKKYTVGRI